MKQAIFISVIVIFSLSGLNRLNAQEATVSSGGDISGEGGSVSFSIGQALYITCFGGTGTVSQGVQQAYEISVITEVKNYDVISLQISAYPNPTPDYLYLKFDGYDPANFLSIKYLLFGTDGKILIKEKVQSSETKIEMRNYVPGIYFLKITDRNTEIKTFKIVKF